MNTQSLKLLWHKLFEPAHSNILGWFRLLFCNRSGDLWRQIFLSAQTGIGILRATGAL
ncbi:MAG: hypothetical protein JNJ49_08370 [Bdellovibrionaceae bacterium]|nr:hypothetical protein [Pseudobdellovibrionaceae bacterium]